MKKQSNPGPTFKKPTPPPAPPKRVPWVMPEWMKNYVRFIVATGGNNVEELVNTTGEEINIQNNAPLALICVAVKSQVDLLTALHKAGEIR